MRVTPKGGRDAVEGWTRDEAGRPLLKVRVSAAASEGAANAAAMALLAKALGVPKSELTLVAGQTARVKRFAADVAKRTWRGRSARRPEAPPTSPLTSPPTSPGRSTLPRLAISSAGAGTRNRLAC